MQASGIEGALLASVSKHDVGGIVAVIVGIALLGFAGVRVAAKMAGAALLAGVGAVVILIGILLFTRSV